MEILAPAGGQEQLIAAVRSGADAVYLGLGAFNARAGDSGFDADALAGAVRFCHARGVKVYVTLNTLVGDSELPGVYALVSDIARSGADAVITQDLAAARLVRECAPGLRLHASTQMAVHNPEGVRALEKLGFSRVVLARELTLQEISNIRKDTSMDIEVFVHGALCMCVSGLCYLSAVLGRRSGNRGRCAQPCRLDFHCNGRGHALSLKDLSAIAHLDRLRDAGVCAVKIEGRLKRPEYVAGAVDACRTALDGGVPDMARLRAVFSRDGFTDGYLTGKRTLDMFGVRGKEDVLAARPVLGELAELYKAERPSVPVDFILDVPESRLTVSDGMQSVTVTGAPAQRARAVPTDYDRARTALAKTGGTPFLFRQLSVENDGYILPVSTLNDLRRRALAQLLDRRGDTPPHACTPLPAWVTNPAGVLSREVDERYGAAAPGEAGLTGALSRAAGLDGSGPAGTDNSSGTIYSLDVAYSSDTDCPSGGVCSAEAIRVPGAVCLLDSAFSLNAPFPSGMAYKCDKVCSPEAETNSGAGRGSEAGCPAKAGRPLLRLRFERATQIAGVEMADKILLPLQVVEKQPVLLERYGSKLIVELPVLCYDMPSLARRLDALGVLGLRAVQADNLGAVHLARRLGLRVHGGAGLNIFNTAALDEYAALGLADAVVSFELRRGAIAALGGGLPRGIFGYGRLPLMRFRACPKNVRSGCKGRDTLTDRIGVDFPLVCENRAYQTLYNSLPVYAADKGDFGVDFHLLYFTDETDSVGSIIVDYAAARTPDFPRTGGLYLRGVE